MEEVYHSGGNNYRWSVMKFYYAYIIVSLLLSIKQSDSISTHHFSGFSVILLFSSLSMCEDPCLASVCPYFIQIYLMPSYFKLLD
jgi:hypothetical protein